MLLWGIILFILAIIIIIADLFFEVFGFIGLLGIGILFFSMYLTYNYVPNGPMIVLGKNLLLIPTALVTAYVFKKKRVLDRVFLMEHLAEDEKEIEDYHAFLGKVGETVTALRPYGHAKFDGAIVEVRSQSNYILAGTQVKVVYVKDQTLFVEKF